MSKSFTTSLLEDTSHIKSDHQPLSYLFNETRGVSQTASSRIQRWALTLSAYHYTIWHKPGTTLSNADPLSWLPRLTTTSADCLPGDLVHLIDHLSATPGNAANIKDWMAKDPLLSKLKRYIRVGWPDTQLEKEFKPYRSRWKELSILNVCILWGSRVVIPPQGQKAALKELHETHPAWL